jgi:hypothetical protein
MVIFYLYKKDKNNEYFNEKEMDEDEQTIDTFSTADDISDVTIIVEEKKIFAHKSILGNKNYL